MKKNKSWEEILVIVDLGFYERLVSSNYSNKNKCDTLDKYVPRLNFFGMFVRSEDWRCQIMKVLNKWWQTVSSGNNIHERSARKFPFFVHRYIIHVEDGKEKLINVSKKQAPRCIIVIFVIHVLKLIKILDKSLNFCPLNSAMCLKFKYSYETF